MIRLGRLKDIPDILRLLSQFHQHSPYRDDPMDVLYVRQLVEATLKLLKEQSVIFLIGEPAHGILIASVSPWAMSGKKVASELAWWIDPDVRKGGDGLLLFNAYEIWAKEIAKADKIQAVSLPDLDVSKIYKRKGYKLVETVYTKDL